MGPRLWGIEVLGHPGVWHVDADRVFQVGTEPSVAWACTDLSNEPFVEQHRMAVAAPGTAGDGRLVEVKESLEGGGGRWRAVYGQHQDARRACEVLEGQTERRQGIRRRPGFVSNALGMFGYPSKIAIDLRPENDDQLVGVGNEVPSMVGQHRLVIEAEQPLRGAHARRSPSAQDDGM